MTLLIDTPEQTVAHIVVSDKTFDTLQQLIALALTDIEQTDTPAPKQQKRRLFHKPERVDPPIEPLNGPSQREIEEIR